MPRITRVSETNVGIVWPVTPAPNLGAHVAKHFAATNSRGGFRYCYSFQAAVNNAPVPSDRTCAGVRRG